MKQNKKNYTAPLKIANGLKLKKTEKQKDIY